MTNNIESTTHRKPQQPLFAIPAVIHWHGHTGTQPIKRTTEIIKYFFCVGLIFICIFVVQNQFIKNGAIQKQQVKSLKDKGAREFQKLISFLSLRDRLVLQRAPLFIHNQKLFKMQNQKREKSTKSAEIGTYVPEIKNLHAGSRQSVINGLFNRPINQLVHDFVVEMDAKNTAYYFILENGHFDAFADYCKNQRKEVCHVNA